MDSTTNQPTQPTDQSQNQPPVQAQVPPAQPQSAPPAAPVTPAPPAPTANQPTSTPIATPPVPKTKQEWMLHLLNKVAPPQNVVTTNPDGTQTVENRATPVSLAHLVLTSALAGSFGTKNVYRDTPYGPVLDRQSTNADAFNRGQQIGQEYSQAAQKQQDDMQTRKLTVVAANLAAAHNYAALRQSQFAAQKEGAEAETANDALLQKTADQNQATTLASADDYDKNLTDTNAPKARLTQKMTWDELMASPFKDKMTSQLMVQDGTRSVYDEHVGRSVLVPTYSVLNPDVKIKLNEATVARMEKINPSFGNNLYKDSGGNVQLPLIQLATLNHQATSVMHAEATLQSLADSNDALASKLGITGDVEGKLAAAARGNSSVWKSLSEFENASAQGGNTADQLQRILQSGGGDAIFKALGTDRDRVQDYIESYNNRLVSARKLAEQGGMGEKAPAAQDQVQRQIQSIRSAPDLSAADKEKLMADVPTADKDGQIHMTQAQVEKLTTRADIMATANKNLQEKTAISNGDPNQIASQTALTVGSGDLSKVGDFSTARTNVRDAYNIAFQKKANELGLNPNHYSLETLKTKAATQDNYSAGGKIGAQLVSFDTFVRHNADAIEASNAWQRTNSPLLNKPMSWLAKNATNDPAYVKFKAALIAPDKEFMGFLNANRAEHEADLKAVNDLTDQNSSPLQIKTALTQLAKTADERAASLGSSYVGTVGTTYPNLMSPNSLRAFKDLGIPSKSAAFTGTLPRNPEFASNPSTQTLKPVPNATMASRFAAAAGYDPERTIELAREHGWILNLK
jgi:hypothetical protein